MGLIPQTSENIINWAHFISSIRDFLKRNGFIEVWTPHLVNEGAFESSIDPLKVTWNGGQGELHTSPEIQMKVLLKTVSVPIYQITHCFRDDLEGPYHSKEFTMLELYKKDQSYRDMMALIEALVSELSSSKLVFQRISVEAFFLKKTGFSLSEMLDVEVFRKTVLKYKLVEASEKDSWEDIFFRILIEWLEPSLNIETPTFLYDYPLAVSPLSERRRNSQFAERFELYWRGLEICNGCTELSDSQELKRRYEAESCKRIACGKSPHPFSEALYDSTSQIGRAAGVAIGLERLFLALYPNH